VPLAVLAAAGVAAAAPPAVEAEAYLVIGDPDGRELLAHAPDERRPVASITKLMTVLVALERASLDETVVVQPAAASIGESTIFLQTGDRIPVRDLAIAALVPSANDAATALALHVGKGSIRRFVLLMNRKARELQMTRTRYANPHGLDQPGHVSTARDSVTLLRAALENPFIRRYAHAARAQIAGGREVLTTDVLLGRVPGIVGAKTGHTDGAGWSQVALVRRGGVQVAAVVLGAATKETRNTSLAGLLEWGVSTYVSVRAVDAARVYARAEVGWSKDPVLIRAPRTLVRIVSLDVPLRERVVAPRVLPLPVRKGQEVGEVRVYARGRLVARSPLLADRTVTRPGVLGRVGWYAGRAAHHVAGIFS